MSERGPWLGPTVEAFPLPELSDKPGPWANISFSNDRIVITVDPKDRDRLAHALLRLAVLLTWKQEPWIEERRPNDG